MEATRYQIEDSEYEIASITFTGKTAERNHLDGREQLMNTTAITTNKHFAGYSLTTYRGMQIEVADYQTYGPRGGIIREWTYRILSTNGYNGSRLSDPMSTKSEALKAAKREVEARG
jgi:hypothetical protein